MEQIIAPIDRAILKEELKNKFDSLYAYMAMSKEPKYMMLFGDVMRHMMEWMIENKPVLAQQCIDKLEAMTCVCSVGLDMIAVPGDTPAETVAAIIADEAAVGMGIGHEETFGVAAVSAAQDGGLVTVFEQGCGVFGMWSLACSAHCYVADADYW